MSEDEFLKKSWKSFMEVEYVNPRGRNIDGGEGLLHPCMVIAVDFNERLLLLEPFPNDLYKLNEDVSFWVRCENVQMPKPKLKALTVVKKEA